MAVIDPRTYRSSTPTGAGRVTTYNEALGETQTPTVDYKAQAAADKANLASGSTTAASVPKAPELHGWKGFVSDVLGNSVTKTVMKPLMLLDYGRRTVVSAAKELVFDPLSGNDTSWHDFTSQVNDQSFGFGKIVADAGGTGNKWADRAIGFIGDVALDPLTYIGGAGARLANEATVVTHTGEVLKGAEELGQHAGGSVGRLNLSRRVLDVTGDAERAAVVARVGRSALTAEEVERLGLAKSGYYMFGKRVKAIRVPLTGPLADFTEEALAKLRLGMSDSALGKQFRKVFAPEDYANVRRTLLQGNIPDGAEEAYIRIATSRNTQRQAAARATQDAQLKIKNVLDSMAPGEVDTFRNTIHKVMEGGVAASPAQDAFARKLMAVMDEFHVDITARMKAFGGDKAGFGKIENYFPHMTTVEAQRAMVKASEGSELSKLKGVLLNPMDPTSVFKSRQLEEGSFFFGEQLTKDQLNVEALNKIATNAGFAGNFFETDVVKVLEKYSQKFGEQVGVVARQQHLEANGVLSKILKESKIAYNVDEAAKAAAFTASKEATDHADNAWFEVTHSLQDVADHLVGARTSAEQMIATRGTEQAAGKAAKVADVAAKTVTRDQAKTSLIKATDMLRGLETKLAAIHGEDLPHAISALQEKIAGVRSKLEELHSVIDAPHVPQEPLAAALAVETVPLSVEQQLAPVHEALSDLQNSLESTFTHNESIGAYEATIAEGGHTIWHSRVGADTSKRAKVKMDVSRAEAFDEVQKTSWWKRSAKVEGRVISKAKVIAHSEASVVDSIGLALADPLKHSDELRDGQFYMVMRDHAAYGEDLPEVVGVSQANVMGSLDRVQYADAAVGAERVAAAPKISAAVSSVSPRELQMQERAVGKAERALREMEAARESYRSQVAETAQAAAERKLGGPSETDLAAAEATRLELGAAAQKQLVKSEKELKTATGLLEKKTGESAKLVGVEKDAAEKELAALRRKIAATEEKVAGLKIDVEQGKNGKQVEAQYTKDINALKRELKKATDVYSAMGGSKKFSHQNAAAEHLLGEEAANMTKNAQVAENMVNNTPRVEKAVRDAAHLDVVIKHLESMQLDPTAPANEIAKREIASVLTGAPPSEIDNLNSAAFSSFDDAESIRAAAEAEAGGGAEAVSAAGTNAGKTAFADMGDGAQVASGGSNETLAAYQAGLDAWNALDSMPKETNGDLIELVKAARAAMDVQVWPNGNNVTWKLSHGAIDPTTGESLAALATHTQQMKHAVDLGGRRVETLKLAEHATTHHVVSEVAQRWLHFSEMYAAHGLVPPKAAFDEVVKAVAAPLHTQWSSQLAALTEKAANSGWDLGEEIAQAQRMVDHLGSAMDAPSQEMFDSLQLDMAARIRAKQTDGTLTAPFLTEDVTGQLAKLKASREKIVNNPDDVALFTSAERAQQTAKAREELAGHDLWKAKTSNGLNGFEDSTGAVIVDRRGDPLAFTEGEWRSLYQLPDSTFVDAEGKAYTAAELPKKIAEKQAFIDGVNEKIAAREADLRAKTAEATRAHKQTDPKFIEWSMREKNAIAGGKNFLQTNGLDQLAVFKAQEAALSGQTRKIAERKFETLVHGGEGTQPWRRDAAVLESTRTAETDVVAARRKLARSEWDANPQRKVIDAVNTIDQKINQLFMDAKFSTPGGAERAANAIEASVPPLPSVAEATTAASEVSVAERIIAEDSGVLARKVEAADALAKVSATSDELTAAVAASEARAASRAAKVAERAPKIKKLEADLVALDDALAARLKVGRTKPQRMLLDKLEEANTGVASEHARLLEAQTALDAAQAVRVPLVRLRGTTLKQLKSDVEHFNMLLNGVPNSVIDWGAEHAAARVEAAGGLVDEAAIKASKKRLAAAGLTEEEGMLMADWIDEVRSRYSGSTRLDPQTEALFIQHDAAVSHWMKTLGDKEAADRVYKAAAKGVPVEEFVPKVRDGFESLARLGYPDLEAQKHIADILTNVKRAEQPAVMQALNRFIGPYTQFFKAYATLSPGFHVRNALSNTFALFGAGADVKNMVEGFGLYKSYREAIGSGVTADSWLLTVPQSQRANAEIALGSMEAAGGGQIGEALGSYMERGTRLTDNKVLRVSRSAGEKVENSARFMLGFDSAVKGLDFESAATRTKRYLFDYMDVGSADANIKQIIPFWTWMSRNLPMTLVNQWTNPRTYAIYNNVVRNFGGADDPSNMTPSYISESGGFKIADNWWITPDTGFNRMTQTVSDIGSFSRLASNVNPVFRLPIELMGSKKLYNGAPIGGKLEKPTGGFMSPAVEALASLLGQSRTGASGEQVVSDKFNYALTNAIPFLNQSEHLVPNTDAMQQRQAASWLSYLGAPVKQVTPDMRLGEQKRRNFAAAQAKRDAKALAKQ